MSQGKTSEELVRCRGKFYIYEDGAFTLRKAKVDICLEHDPTGDTENLKAYDMVVYDEHNTRIAADPVDTTTLARFYSSELSVTWVAETASDRISLSVKFEDASSFVKFRNQFSVCLYEVQNPKPFEELKAEDQRYVMESERDDVIMDNTSDAEDEDEEVLEEPRDGTRMEDESQEHNSHLAVAYNNDRTFVIRGKNMGVFKTDDDGVKFRTLVQLKDQKRNSFAPSQVMLHEQDHSMLFLNPEEHNKVYRMDLERGDIVNEFDSGYFPVNTMQYASKYANLDPSQDFLGMNRSTLLRFDPRDKDFVVQKKTYAPSTKTMFTNMSTTGNGCIAASSENGDIRLYNELGKNAKTHLPGLGDPIIGLDTTEDGAFVLATTRTYLLVLDTRVKGQEKGGFLKSMGKDKPAPLKLTIKPTDVIKHRMKEVCFTPARFDVGRSMEKSIVTSTGPFIVTWNFRHVKQGRPDSYQIKRYKDNVVADTFTFDDDERIVVTLPDDVTVNRVRRGRTRGD
mmetsp:Transcript_1909/g.5753  ORF Transcript_1909/g.5753 Transcript_1909/m.5753 type:complete len:510 (-) Transcript_1909:840-2369(-)|eukprot:CAMPEP_0198728936 /NCGR_PEP_ID=MMETSP1475-20131203/12299_1 /TAXON_ID= ORGANISM="Unidentified sp., Strain CCMP1999" /NCGR_SAMPLE_ID=MMETSP1475 /ASSEMBLY_ACC=CAM_ASM_001111 /LENGTH=509 /DNA_ID=CAMNT_0044491431 /DNA_START=177 /DNA_END=1706 /DNA_ORIENTATION=-